MDHLYVLQKLITVISEVVVTINLSENEKLMSYLLNICIYPRKPLRARIPTEVSFRNEFYLEVNLFSFLSQRRLKTSADI